MEKLEAQIDNRQYLTLVLSFLLCIAAFTLVKLPAQGDFHIIAPLFTIAFICYGYILAKPSRYYFKSILFLSVSIRLALIFLFPNLSDDIYRFIWDGKLIGHGLNPYSLYPPDVLEMHLTGLSESLYNQMNSPNYYTVYPPIAQFIYYVGGLFDSWYTGAIAIKTILFAAEMLNIYLIIALLKVIRLETTNVLIYALNPLIIVELSGNMHFESLMITFILLSLLFLAKGKIVHTAIALALGVGTKLLPLLFLAYFWKYYKLNRTLIVVFSIVTIITFLPVLLGIQITNFLSSIDLYFGKFEFNGSLYYCLRFIGYHLSGYNLIRYLGPLLGLSTLFVAYRLFKRPHTSLNHVITSCFIIFCCYLFLGTTIHPWYLSVPIALSCFIPFRFVLIWSSLICYTYINYSYNAYHENLWVVALEYGVVFSIMIYEVNKYKKEVITRNTIPNTL